MLGARCPRGGRCRYRNLSASGSRILAAPARHGVVDHLSPGGVSAEALAGVMGTVMGAVAGLRLLPAASHPRTGASWLPGFPGTDVGPKAVRGHGGPGFPDLTQGLTSFITDWFYVKRPSFSALRPGV